MKASTFISYGADLLSVHSELNGCRIKPSPSSYARELEKVSALLTDEVLADDATFLGSFIKKKIKILSMLCK